MAVKEEKKAMEHVENGSREAWSLFDCEWRCCRFQTTRCYVLALFQISTVMGVPTYSFSDPPLQEPVQKATAAENYNALKKINIYRVKIPVIPKAHE